jgi:hypothetical protein
MYTYDQIVLYSLPELNGVTHHATHSQLQRPHTSMHTHTHTYIYTYLHAYIQVVLYSLPELDGAIDAIPLGGLCCGDKEFCNSQRDLKSCQRESGEIRLYNRHMPRYFYACVYACICLCATVNNYVTVMATFKTARECQERSVYMYMCQYSFICMYSSLPHTRTHIHTHT